MGIAGQLAGRVIAFSDLVRGGAMRRSGLVVMRGGVRMGLLIHGGFLFVSTRRDACVHYLYERLNMVNVTEGRRLKCG